jgi:hypothetical protein
MPPRAAASATIPAVNAAPVPQVRRAYRAIERRPRIDRETLRREFLARNRPVVFSSGDADFCARWAPPALADRFGRAPVETEEAGVVYVGERALAFRPLADLVEAMRTDDTRLRWKGLDFLARVPGMREDLTARPPPHRAHLPATAGALRDTLWLAPQGTMSSLHHDGDYDNLNLQVSGRKLFLLLPPPWRRELYAYGSAESPINPFVPDLGRFPRFPAGEVVEATLDPGDVLLIPKYWWHCVYTLRPAVNLSTHFRWRGELSPWQVLQGSPLAHRTLTVAAAALKRRGLHGVADATRRAWCAVYGRVVPRVVPQARCVLAEAREQGA